MMLDQERMKFSSPQSFPKCGDGGDLNGSYTRPECYQAFVLRHKHLGRKPRSVSSGISLTLAHLSPAQICAGWSIALKFEELKIGLTN